MQCLSATVLILLGISLTFYHGQCSGDTPLTHDMIRSASNKACFTVRQRITSAMVYVVVVVLYSYCITLWPKGWGVYIVYKYIYLDTCI